MGKNIIIKVLVFLALMPAGSYSQEKIRIAILDLKAKNVSKVTTGAITDLIRSEVVGSGLFKVVERSQIDIILKEQGFQQTGCTDQDCAVKIGKIVSANKMLIGEASRIEDALLITCRIVDVKEGVSEYAATEKVFDEVVLDVAAKSLVKKLIAKIEGRDRESTPAENPVVSNEEQDAYGNYYRKAGPTYYLLGLVPGAGQFYMRRYAKGGIFLGAFAVTGIVWLYTSLDYYAKRKEYEDLGPYSSAGTFDSKYKAADEAASRAKIAAGVFIAVYALNLIDIIFITSRTEYALNTGNPADRMFSSSNIKINYYDRHDARGGHFFDISYNIRF